MYMSGSRDGSPRMSPYGLRRQPTRQQIQQQRQRHAQPQPQSHGSWDARASSASRKPIGAAGRSRSPRTLSSRYGRRGGAPPTAVVRSPGGLQERVDATLKELEEIKAGTHAACIPLAPSKRHAPHAAHIIAPAGHAAVAAGTAAPRRVETHRAPSRVVPVVAVEEMASVGAARRRPPVTSRELEAMLTSLGLGQYQLGLMAHGFENVAALRSAVAADLQAAGMKMGHALRLLNGVRKHQPGSAEPDISAGERGPFMVPGACDSGCRRGTTSPESSNTKNTQITGDANSQHSPSSSMRSKATPSYTSSSALSQLPPPEDRNREIKLNRPAGINNLYNRRDNARLVIRQVTAH